MSARIPDQASSTRGREIFGFWPASNNVYVIATSTIGSRDREGNSHDESPMLETWLYNADGSFVGWIAGYRVADSTTSGAMLFLSNGRLVTLTKDYRVDAVARFVWPDKSIAEPEHIFPDLKLGFFHQGDHLQLARW